MSSTVRNVNKNQIVAEDMALGMGKVSQTRNGKTVEGSRIDIPVPVFSVADIEAYSPLVSTRLVLEVAPDKYVYYIYRAGETDGIPAIGGGVWVPQNLKSDIKLATSSDAALTLNGANNNEFVTVDNAIGVSITVGRAERDLGYGVVPAVPSLIFINSATDGVVDIAGDTGIEVTGPGQLRLAGKGSTVGLIAVAVDKWVLMGDVAVV